MKTKFLIILIIAAQLLLAKSDFSSEEFKNRRNKLAQEMGPNSIAILQGAPSETGYVKFRQYN